MNRNGAVLDDSREIEIGLREIRSCRQGIVSLCLVNVIFDEYGCMDDPGGQSLDACAVLGPGKQANLADPDVYPVPLLLLRCS